MANSLYLEEAFAQQWDDLKATEMNQAAPIPSVPAHIFDDVVKEHVQVVPAPQLAQKRDTGTSSLLDELASVERLHITKRLHVKSVIFLRGKKNKFFIRTPDSNLLFTVEEENSWWVGYFFYGLRPMQLRVLNSAGVEVMTIYRPYACTPRILPCQLQRLQVFAPPGCLIGTVEQLWAAIRPLYVVKNVDGEEVFSIRGPYITVSLFRDLEFTVRRPSGAFVGNTCKRWQGLVHALFLAPVTDRFGVTFDGRLKTEEKALLLAASLLIDYMYYDM